jgi:hypothetical protein
MISCVGWWLKVQQVMNAPVLPKQGPYIRPSNKFPCLPNHIHELVRKKLHKSVYTSIRRLLASVQVPSKSLTHHHYMTRWWRREGEEWKMASHTIPAIVICKRSLTSAASQKFSYKWHPQHVGLRSLTFSTYKATVSPLSRPQSEEPRTWKPQNIFKGYIQQSI